MASRSVLLAGNPGLTPAAEPGIGPIVFYPTDATIFAQGDKAGPLYVVEFGTVRVC